FHCTRLPVRKCTVFASSAKAGFGSTWAQPASAPAPKTRPKFLMAFMLSFLLRHKLHSADRAIAPLIRAHLPMRRTRVNRAFRLHLLLHSLMLHLAMLHARHVAHVVFYFLRAFCVRRGYTQLPLDCERCFILGQKISRHSR